MTRDSGTGTTPRESPEETKRLAKIADRLWAAEKVSRADYDTDEVAFAAVKAMIFALRRDVEERRV